MIILITGVTGFVGKNLKEYLSNGSNQILSMPLRNDNWEEHFDYNCDALIHLAGKAHDLTNSSNDEEYYKVNRDLTINIFEKFLKSNIRDFIFFSSVKAAADTVDGVLTENYPLSPKTAYGKSKLEAEKYLLNKDLPFGKRLFIIRPCMIHGPGNKGNLNLLYNVVKKGIPWPLGKFHNCRSFLSIDNLCYLIAQILENKEVKSGIYNFADDKSISTNALVKIISEVIGEKEKIWNVNKNFIELISKLGDILSLPLNSERLKKLTESYVVSNQKIKKELNLTILPISLEDGIKKTIQSFSNKK